MTKVRLLAGMALFSMACLAQERGTITGTLTDPTGAVVPGVRISIRNLANNAAYQSATTSAGEYTAPNLPAGKYEMVFEANGLKRLVQTDVEVGVSQTVRVDATLQIGATAETVSVTAESELLQKDTSSVGQTLQNHQVIDLPLSFAGGRNASSFAAQLVPGVTGNNLVGTPNFSKSVLIDGATATGYRSGDISEESPSPEALQEFKVETSGMSAEYGKSSGGVFNFVMKSGANQVHGSGLFEARNEFFNAKPFSSNFFGLPKTRDRQVDGGGGVGGPVYIPKVYNGKDKTFFYFTYERFHTAGGGNTVPNETVPPPSWLNGDMSDLLTNQVVGKDALGNNIVRGAIYDPLTSQTVGGTLVRNMFPGNIIPQSRISSVSKTVNALMAKDYPATVAGPNGDYLVANNAFSGPLNWQNYTQLSIKADENISSRNHLSGSLSRTIRPAFQTAASGTHVYNFDLPNGGPFSSAIIKPVNTHMLHIAHDYTVTPTVLNHLSLYFNRVTNSIINLHADEPNPVNIANTNKLSVPTINWSGGDRYSLTNLGQDKASDSVRGITYGYGDTLTWVKGRHSLKFGAEYRVYKLNYIRDPDSGNFTFSSNQTGLPGFTQFVGNPYASFLLGAVNNASVGITTPTLAIYKSFDAFVQDDFKAISRLTLNLGLRWDLNPVQTEEHDRLSTFNPTKIDPVSGLPGAVDFAGNCSVCTGKRGFGTISYKNFGPRLGFAYQITPKLVVRGAYGIFFADRAPNDYYGDPNGISSLRGFGWGVSNVVNYGNDFQPAFNWDQGYPGVNKYSTPNPSQANLQGGALSWDPDSGRLGYTQTWNLNIQRQLPFKMLLDVGYVGTKGTGLEANGLRVVNQLPASDLVLGSLLTSTVNSQAAIPARALALGARYPFAAPGQSVPLWQTLSQFPQVLNGGTIGGWDAPLGFSTYHALQVQLNKQFSHGIGWVSNYTFSKTIANITDVYSVGVNPGLMVANNLALQKSIASFDQPQVVKIGLNYEFPFGKGKLVGSHMNALFNGVFGGWTASWIGNYNSGTPLSFGANSAASGTTLATNRALLTNPDGVGLGVPFDSKKFDYSVVQVATTNNLYLNRQYIQQPAPYTLGTAAPNVSQIRGFWGRSENISLQKNFSVHERARLQFRAELLNAFNRHTFGGISTNPNSVTFGNVTSVSGNRTVQLGTRIDF